MAERAVDLRQAQSRLVEIVHEAADGEEIVLTEGGEPVARIVPISRRRRPREFGSAKGLIRMADDFDAPLEDFREYV